MHELLLYIRLEESLASFKGGLANHTPSVDDQFLLSFCQTHGKIEKLEIKQKNGKVFECQDKDAALVLGWQITNTVEAKFILSSQCHRHKHGKTW